MSNSETLPYFQILQIEPTPDINAVRNAYRECAKLYHPDIQNELSDVEKHEKMIAINEAYAYLKTALSTQDVPVVPETLASSETDPAYADYKTGWDIFHSVHPDSWTNIRLKDLPPGSLLRDIIPYRKRMVKEAYQNLSRAYYYFSRVVTDYPNSDWAYDAAEKMEKITALTRRYKSILKTFGAE